MIKNFDNSFNGANTSALTPILIHTVVMIAAMMKYKMNIGNALFRLNLFCGRISSSGFLRQILHGSGIIPV